MKTITSNEFSPFAARTLKLVGVILILSFLLDFVSLLIPFKPLDQIWQIGFTTQLVEPGVIPMVGLALLFTGYWLDNSASDPTNNHKPWLDLRLWGLLFSALFGLLFLVLSPLHLNNINQASAQAIAQIDQKAEHDTTDVQNQLSNPQTQAQLQQQQSQVKAQINSLLKNDQQYNQVIQSDKVPPQFKDLIKQSKANPQAIDQLVQQRLSPEALRTQALNAIQRRQAESEQQATQDAWKSGLRIGTTSLLLAIGYIAIGWMGLRSMGFLSPERRRSSAR